jgi:hypothetical protein
MSRIVRACVNTTRLREIGAQVAGSGFLFYDGFGAAGMIGIFIHHLERMQINIAVRTIARAKTAADAPVLDDDFERVTAANGADRTAHHAKRIAALPATGSNQILLEAQAIAYQAGNAIVSVRASVYAGVAARAFLQIENQQTLRFHQALGKKLIQGHGVDRFKTLLIGEAALRRDSFQAFSNGGEALNHLTKIVARNANDLHVIQCGAHGGSHASAEQANLAKIISARQVREDHLAAGIIFGNFHEADAYEVKAVSGIALARDDLAGSEALQFHALLQVVDEVR